MPHPSPAHLFCLIHVCIPTIHYYHYLPHTHCITTLPHLPLPTYSTHLPVFISLTPPCTLTSHPPFLLSHVYTVPHHFLHTPPRSSLLPTTLSTTHYRVMCLFMPLCTTPPSAMYPTTTIPHPNHLTYTSDTTHSPCLHTLFLPLTTHYAQHCHLHTHLARSPPLLPALFCLPAAVMLLYLHRDADTTAYHHPPTPPSRGARALAIMRVFIAPCLPALHYRAAPAHLPTSIPASPTCPPYHCLPPPHPTPKTYHTYTIHCAPAWHSPLSAPAPCLRRTFRALCSASRSLLYLYLQ